MWHKVLCKRPVSPVKTLLVYLFYISQTICTALGLRWASLVAQTVKNPPAMQVTRIRSLGQEDPLEKGMATYSSILAWEILWTEEPGGLQSMGSESQICSQAQDTFSIISGDSPCCTTPLRRLCAQDSLHPSLPLAPKDKCSLEEQFTGLRTVKKTSLHSQSTGFVPILPTEPQRLHLRPILGKVGRKKGEYRVSCQAHTET